MEHTPLMLEIGQVHREWKNYMRKLALEAGIPDSYRMIVMYLARNPGVSQKELSENTCRTGAAISQTVKEMQLTGFVKKCKDSSDGRASKLYLTEKGQASADAVREKIHAADAVITSAITPEKEAELVELLEHLCGTIRKEL